MLLDKIKKQVDRYDIISFDIFDTLLLRPYVKPTDLFLHLEKLENKSGFAKARIEAEQKARKVHNDLEDITLDEIYNEIDDEYKTLKSKEMNLEMQVLQPNPEIKEVFDYAKEQKKRIMIVTDMYLPAEFLSKVLKTNGYEGFEKLYVSCEYRKTKWNGSLYKLVLKDMDISAKKVFHIGDNESSDNKIATKMKITSYLYKKTIDKLFETNARAKKFYENNSKDLGASIVLGLLSLENINMNNNYWENFGFNYGGPVVYAYMQWLDQKLKEDKIHEAMFVARDGYTLEKVFNILKTTDVTTHYYYSPRILNLVCNLNYEKNIELGEHVGMFALNSILNYFKSKDKWLAENTPEIKNCTEGDEFIKSHMDLYRKLANDKTKDFQKYFKQFNIKNKDIALVDTCSSFLSAQKSLLIGLLNSNIKGYYWFTWEGTQNDIKKYNTITFQKSHKQEFVDWNIMELYMTAPTPPVKDIENGTVIFKQITDAEQIRMNIYPDLSQGIVNFATLCSYVFGKLNLFITAETMIDFTNILCTIPTDIDKEHFSKIQHAYDAEHTKWIPLLRPWFENNTSEYDSGEKLKEIIRLYVFNIPIIKIKKTQYRYLLSLFNILPLFKYKKKIDRKCIYLFGIPLFQIKQKKNKQTFSLFKFLPIVSIKRK